MVEGVPTVEDNSSSDDDMTSDSSEGVRTERGGLMRTGSNASTGSRTNSMRAKPIKKIPASPDGEISPDDVQEAVAEVERAAKSGSANLHQLRLGLDVGLIKKLIQNNNLAGLTELVLSENGIESLPHSIFDRVPKLQKLDLSNNKLTVIPLSAMTLPCLHTLLLDHNQISGVPATYDIAEPLELPSLTKIGLDWNKLTEFPSHLYEVAPKLKNIFMSDNLGLQSLPPLDSFPLPGADGKVELKLDNKPTLQDQFKRGGYDARIVVEWNKIYPDKVMDYVYLGSIRTAQCVEVYHDLDIKYVLTAGRELDVYLAKGMVQLELLLDDVPNEDPSPFFSEAFDFIDKAISEKKGVLLHCFAGLSRSVTVCVAYLMKTRYPMTMDEALELVRTARPSSHPNEGFLRVLRRFEEQLKEQHA